MTARNHLALCEAKRGGATEEERALRAELELAEERITHLERTIIASTAWVERAKAAEARCRRLVDAIEAYKECPNSYGSKMLDRAIKEARDE